MTVVLVAVYVPIGFQGGLTGALFTEFAFTLVGAVTISAHRRADAVADDVLAPAASPQSATARLAGAAYPASSTAVSSACARCYERWLHGSLDYLPVTSVFALLVLSSIYFLYAGAKSELAPQEDQGVVIASSTLGAERHAAAEACCTRSRSIEIIKELSGDRSRVPDRRAGHGRSPAWCSSRGTSGREPATSSSRSCSRSSTRSPARASPRSSCRRCRAVRACRCSSSSRRPSRSIGSTRSRSGSCKDARRQRNVHLPRHRPQDRQAASRGRDRPRQGRAARPQDERVGSAMAAMLGGGYVNYFASIGAPTR